jgi:L-ascorbate metabolism protein UlaG (beta-lactamase superfamily)
MSLFPALGKAPAGLRLQRIKRSPNYNGKTFQNLVNTPVSREGVSMFKMMRELSNRPASTAPPKPIPSIHTNLQTLPDDQATIVWFGHSSYLLKINKTHILVDPVFSGNASPVSFLAKAYPGSNVYGAKDMPATLEAVLLTHDHYDHLDYKTIIELKTRTNHFYTSLGVGAHLEYWGIEPEKITELDWWENIHFDEAGRVVGKEGRIAGKEDQTAGQQNNAPGENAAFTLTATPGRHFSGRGLKRGGAIWSAFVLQTPGYRLFLGGDSGYEQHFKSIGERFGPFDLAILECGQYNENWPYIHMMPEQTVQAAKDLKAKTLLPVHWGKFTLALHPWDEPIRRMTAAAMREKQPITTPRIGEPVTVNHQYPNSSWYDFL